MNLNYDVGKAFAAIEDELIASMIRNMERHKVEEIKEDKQWEMWQTMQLKSLERYRQQNRKKYGPQFAEMNQKMTDLIRKAKQSGKMEQEVKILQAIKRGYKGLGKNKSPVHQPMTAEFFKLNEEKLEALIKATTHDMKRAEIAILRMADDQYRKVIFNAQVYANTGAGTYEKAVDMATKDMLASGLNCVEYANGSRHRLQDYADMAIRTASKRAYLQGEGEKRQEWGITTVILNKRGNPCPKCLPFCGKVLIDDVWSGGKSDGKSPVTGIKYPLMSKAIKSGLYHPRCKDTHTTYFEGISTPPDDKYTKEELDQIAENYKEEQKKQYAKRQAEKFERLEKYSLDEDNKKLYSFKLQSWIQEIERYSVTDDVRIHREDTPQRMVDLVKRYTADEFVVIDENTDAAFVYDLNLDVVVINIQHPTYPYYEYRETMIHEIAHRIDQNEFGSPMSLQFSEAIIKTEKQLVASADKYNLLFEVGGKFEYNMLISDILGCITDNVIKGSSYHSSQYIGIPGYTELEVFANLFSALYQGDDETVEFIKNELKDIYKAFIGIIGE